MSGKKSHGLQFGKENYKWMAIGAVVIVISLLLMAGGGNPDPNTFNAKEVYSTRRITIAPIVLVLGLVIEMYAIMRPPRSAGEGE